MAEISRASKMAIKEESSVGVLVAPTVGTDFIELRPNDTLTPNVETLNSEELLNDIGAGKTLTGKEGPSGSHPAYAKHSGTEGAEPATSLLWESLMGTKTVNATEYNTVAACTTSVIKVDAGEGALFEVGQAVLCKDGANGYSIRNVESITGDNLTLNFNVAVAPGVGVNLGKVILIKPASSGHPSYSVWKEDGSAAAIEAIAGCRTQQATLTAQAGQQATVDFTFNGTSYYFNPIQITAANKYLDVTDDIGTFVVTLTEAIYKSPVALADHIAAAMTQAGVASGGDTYTCVYSSVTGMMTIASNGTVFSLLWKTGTHGSDNANNSVAAAIGFSTAADDTLALTYTSDTAIVHAINITPSYQGQDAIVVKGAELMIGDATDSFCRKASNLTLTVTTNQVDVDSICATSGLEERLPNSRTAQLTATLILQKHEVGLFDKFINNKTSQLMLNIGVKDSAGNWTAGKCMNVYFGNCSITGHVVGGTDFLTVELTANGFVSSTKKDCYINFV